MGERESVTEYYDVVRIDRLDLGGVEVALVGVEHDYNLRPIDNPWDIIDREIGSSSLIFVEYFPYELETNTYNVPVFGWYARKVSEDKGVDSFFDGIAAVASRCKKEIGVADIANSPLYEILYNLVRAVPSFPLFASNPQILTNPVTSVFTLMLGSLPLYLVEQFGLGPFSKTRQNWERFFVDMEDARRLITARGIEQEAKRRKNGAKFAYFAPEAHTARVRWFLENPTDVSTNAKAKLYNVISLATGLPKNIRLYKPSGGGWIRVSNEAIRL